VLLWSWASSSPIRVLDTEDEGANICRNVRSCVPNYTPWYPWEHVCFKFTDSCVFPCLGWNKLQCELRRPFSWKSVCFFWYGANIISKLASTKNTRIPMHLLSFAFTWSTDLCGRQKTFFFLQDSFCGQTTFPLKGCRGFYPRAKRLWWESDMPFTFQFTFTFTFRGYDCLSARNHSLSWNIIPLLFSMSCDQVHSHFRSTFSTQYSTVLLISVSMFLSFIKATQ
jgi:hypothetical protein